MTLGGELQAARDTTAAAARAVGAWVTAAPVADQPLRIGVFMLVAGAACALFSPEENATAERIAAGPGPDVPMPPAEIVRQLLARVDVLTAHRGAS